jgi:hypothetical protein
MANPTPSRLRTARSTRVPVTERNILSVKGKEDGYHYRIVNDTGDRVQQLMDAGYEIVDASSVQVGDKRINSTSPEGTQAQVSVGGGVKAFVMRQKLEWYNEDQAAKQSRVNQLEETITQSAGANGLSGSVKLSRS